MKKFLNFVVFISFLLSFNNFIMGKNIVKAPIEISNFSRLTNYNEMIHFLKKISSHKKSIVRLKIIGKSVEGKDIPALFFSYNNDFKRDKR